MLQLGAVIAFDSCFPGGLWLQQVKLSKTVLVERGRSRYSMVPSSFTITAGFLSFQIIIVLLNMILPFIRPCFYQGGAVVDSSQTDPHFEARDESEPTHSNPTNLPRQAYALCRMVTHNAGLMTVAK